MAKKSTVSQEKKIVTQLDGPYLQYQNKRLLDFSSHDFLGLSEHPDVKKSAIRYTLKLGAGTLSSQYESLPQKQIEEKLSQLLGFEKTIFFNSFSEALSFLLPPGTLIFSDTPFGSSETFSSPEQLKTLLSKIKNASKQRIIIILSSPSFDLKTLQKIAKENDALLSFNDQDHFGISGKRGLGFGALQKELDYLIGSFDHAFSSPIAYIAASEKLLQERPAIQPLTPSLLGALDAVLTLLPDMDSERAQLEKHTTWLHARLQSKGFKKPKSKSPKMTLSFSTEEEAERLSNFFIENDIIVGSPSPKEISLSVTALHTPDDLDQLQTALKKLSDTDFALATQSSTPTP